MSEDFQHAIVFLHHQLLFVDFNISDALDNFFKYSYNGMLDVVIEFSQTIV